MRCLPFLVGCFFSVAVGADSISARYVRAPAGASALGGAQRAPPSSKAGPLVRFNAPLGH